MNLRQALASVLSLALLSGCGCSLWLLTKYRPSRGSQQDALLKDYSFDRMEDTSPALGRQLSDLPCSRTLGIRQRLPQDKTTFLVLMAVHKRYNLTALVLKHFKDMQVRMAAKGSPLKLKLLAVGADVRHERLAREHGWLYADASHIWFMRTSDQWSFGLKAAQRISWDFLTIVGSDNLFGEDLFHEFASRFLNQGYAMVGISDFWIFDRDSKKGLYFSGYTDYRKRRPIGLCRTFHRKVVEAMHFHLWPSWKSRNLDGEMWKLLEEHVPCVAETVGLVTVKDLNQYVLDVKSSQNQITPLSLFDSLSGTVPYEDGCKMLREIDFPDPTVLSCQK